MLRGEQRSKADEVGFSRYELFWCGERSSPYRMLEPVSTRSGRSSVVHKLAGFMSCMAIMRIDSWELRAVGVIQDLSGGSSGS
jgi:hypothetical protein